MRYFTRAWASGELTDDEWHSAVTTYRARLAAIAPRLPEAVLRLARDVSLHDGLIESIVWSPAKRSLGLSLVCGNLQTGYFLVQLTYDGAMLGSERVESLRRVAESRHTELLYDEVDVDDQEGHFSHRLLFHPWEEVTIAFEQLGMTVSARPDRRVELLGPFSEERPDEDEDSSSGRRR